MDKDEHADHETRQVSSFAGAAFLKIEVIAYLVLGLMLALTALIGIIGAGRSLWATLLDHSDPDAVVITIDRLLFVLMVVEILHTVRVSFRLGTLVCEPFLVVGLIASVRRMLVITLESSQANQPSKWTIDNVSFFNATMYELIVLGGLILVMVVSIFILRRSASHPPLE